MPDIFYARNVPACGIPGSFKPLYTCTCAFFWVDKSALNEKRRNFFFLRRKSKRKGVNSVFTYAVPNREREVGWLVGLLVRERGPGPHNCSSYLEIPGL